MILLHCITLYLSTKWCFLINISFTFAKLCNFTSTVIKVWNQLVTSLLWYLYKYVFTLYISLRYQVDFHIWCKLYDNMKNLSSKQLISFPYCLLDDIRPFSSWPFCLPGPFASPGKRNYCIPQTFASHLPPSPFCLPRPFVSWPFSPRPFFASQTFASWGHFCLRETFVSTGPLCYGDLASQSLFPLEESCEMLPPCCFASAPGIFSLNKILHFFTLDQIQSVAFQKKNFLDNFHI